MVTAGVSWTTGYFEFHFRSDLVQTFLYDRIVRQLPCLPSPFEVPSQGRTVVDHIQPLGKPHFARRPGIHALEWGTEDVDSGFVPYHKSIKSFDGAVLQLVQPVRVLASTLSALNDAGPGAVADDTFMKLDLDIVFDFELVKDKNQFKLALVNGSAKLHGSEAPLPAWISEKVDAILEGIGTSDPLDLSPLDDFIPHPDKLITEYGVSASKDFASLAMRFLIWSFQSTEQDWIDFYNGDFDNLTTIKTSYVLPAQRDPAAPKQKEPDVDPQTVTASVSGDWSVWFDSNTFLPKMANDTQQGIIDDGRLQLVSPVTADWVAAKSIAAIAQVAIGFQAVVNAPDEISGLLPVDLTTPVGVSANTDIELVGAASDTLQAWSVIGWDADLGDDAEAMTLFGGFVGGILGTIIGGAVGLVVGGAVGAAAGNAAVYVAAGLVSPPLPPIKGWDCPPQPDAHNLICTKKLTIPQVPLVGELRPTVIHPYRNGMIIFGSLEHTELTDLPSIDDVSVTGFGDWGIRDLCGSPEIAVSANVTLSSSRATPLRLCHWEVVNDTFYSDTLGQFKSDFFQVEQVSASGNSWISIDITIGAGDVVDGYAAGRIGAVGYPLKLLVQTNGGTRVITINGFSRISSEEEQALKVKIEIERPITCGNYTAGGDWFHFNPKWAVDPGPEGLPERKWTRVIATGLIGGDLVTIYDAESHTPISSATASLAGIASVDAVVEPGVNVGVSHAIPAPAARENPSPARHARRTLLIQRRLTRFSKIEYDEPVQAVAAGRVNGRAMLLVNLKARQLVYELTDLNAPRLKRIERQQGLLGLARIVQGWVVWGDFGLRVLNPVGRCYPADLPDPLLNLDDGPVHHIALLGDGRLLLSRPQGNEVRSIRRSNDLSWTRQSTQFLEPARPLQPWPGRIHTADPWLRSAARTGDVIASLESNGVGIWSVTASYLNGSRRGVIAEATRGLEARS
jgi:hypothetical protein